MKWYGKGSKNVENGGGGGGRIALGGGLGIILVLVGLFLGQDVTGLIEQLPASSPSSSRTDDQDPRVQFVSGVLESTEQVWQREFKKMGIEYQEPVLRHFIGSTTSACGNASAAIGPFYCPADQKVYIDLSFFEELKTNFGAAGDFAQAYVIAHEVGHHVQNLLGLTAKMEKARRQLSEKEYNQLSVSLELQADFYAGLWAHQAQNLKDFVLEEGDIEEALNAANAIGDDRLQQKSQGEVVPDSFTHGTSAQRMYWFKKGFQTGNIREGNTFKQNF